MMLDTKNLWPKELLTGDDILLPITILREQAKYFNQMTRNIVVAEVKTKAVEIPNKNSNLPQQGILHTLKIVAPAIGNYDFELLRLLQQDISPYPLEVYAPLLELKYNISGPMDLEQCLKEIFTNFKTVRAIQSLMTQSKE